jgi:O-antigen/teichoic acid export membrane protein
MANRLFRRRSAAAVWIYVSVACGILGTIVAARVLGLDEFGVFATSLAVVGFFQILLDLTVEESLTKYGFRYAEARDWGRLRRLFRQMLLLKLAGGLLATLILIGLAPFADDLFDADGVTAALLAASLLPLVQSSENVAATALLLHGRYDLRGAYQAGSAGLRLLAIVVAAPHGVTVTLVGIVVAQFVAMLVISVIARALPERTVAASRRGRGRHPILRRPVEHRDRRDLRSHHARAHRARARGRADPGRSLPRLTDAPDRSRRSELSCPARAPHRADARVGAW